VDQQAGQAGFFRGLTRDAAFSSWCAWDALFLLTILSANAVLASFLPLPACRWLRASLMGDGLRG